MAYDVVQFDITRSGSEEIELVSREGPPFKLTLLLPLGCSDESTIEFEERFALHPRASQPAEDPSPGEDRLITLGAS